MNYTLRILKGGSAVLDGSTLLNPSSPGVIIDNASSGEIEVTVPDGVPLGAIDPGQVLDATAVTEGLGSGRTFIVSTFSITSAGGSYPGPGTNIVERVTPTAGTQANRETLQDLSTNNGLPVSDRRIFMPLHLIAFTTTVAGPHTISLFITPLKDEDIAGAFVEQ